MFLRAKNNMAERINRIALINLEGDLETLEPDASSRRKLTQGDRFFQFPAWSPDSKRLAVVGGNSERAGVFILNDDNALIPTESDSTQTVFESANSAPIYCYWSPDGNHLSFIAIRPDDQSLGLHIASTKTSLLRQEQRTKLVALGRPCFWDWTPDGKRILLHSGSWDNNPKLSMIDPFSPGTSGSIIARPGSFQAPGIAHSGRYWAFGQTNRKNEVKLIVDSQNKQDRIEIQHEGLAAMSWSPVSDELAYISPPEAMKTYYGPLRLLNAETGEVRMLSDEVVLAFFWSPDGKKIAYFTIAHVGEGVMRMLYPDPIDAARDGGFRPKPRRNSDEANIEEDQPTLWLNVWVVDIETGDKQLITTFEPVDIFVNQFLPFFDQYAKSHRIWSPDSNALVLPMLGFRNTGEPTAYVHVVSTDWRVPKRVIAEGLMAFWSQS